MLIIAHHMRTIAHADKVVVMMDGKVSETGTPEELIEHQGYFAHMLKGKVKK